MIIITDDQGYADLSCFGGKHVYTSNIDQMAKEGARLTSFYVVAPKKTNGSKASGGRGKHCISTLKGSRARLKNGR